MDVSFPSDFLFGAATSSYQIEGAHDRDGKGESIWDRFSHIPGKIKDGTTGDLACDHYYRYQRDVDLMKELGHEAYRFSISWPRVLPKGQGRPNTAGLDFYSRLVDALLDAGIQPFVTLYHWDLPQALQEKGGWSSRDIAGWFADYANLMARNLADRVQHWITLNEPQIFSTLGYLLGQHAPGINDPGQYFRASHFINLAHGRAVEAIRDESDMARIGTVLQLPPVHPSTDSDKDVEAARIMDGFLNRWYAEPVLLGRYPQDMLDLFSPLDLPVEEGDMEVIYKPLDFAGLNLYTRLFACHDPDTPLLESRIDFGHRVPGSRYTDFGWEVYPPSMFESLMRFKDEWGDPEVYITENGSAEAERPVNGVVDDKDRIDYLSSYLYEVARAMDKGVKVKGYFAWSLMDNFEWSEGFTKRFGVCRTDFDTLERTPKKSALWYRELIANRGFRL
ncbi:MAG: GH1 family beta-glucosidase [bacterium]